MATKPKAKASLKPTTKVTAAGAGGALAALLVSLADMVGLDLPVSVAAAIVALASFALGYFRRE